MILKIKFLCLFLVLMCFATTTSFAVTSQEKDVDLLLQTLHYRESLQNLPKFLSAQFMQAIQPMTTPLGIARIKSQVESITEEIFSEKAILQETRQALISSLSEEELSRIRESAQMPLIEKITKLEAQELAPDFQERLSAYLQYLQNHPIPVRRGALLRQLSRALGGTEMSRDAFMAVAKSSAMVAAHLEGKTGDEKMVDDALAKEATNLLPQLEERFIATKAYVYKDLSDEELASYLQIMNRDEWQKATHVINGIFKDRFEKWTKAITKAFAR